MHLNTVQWYFLTHLVNIFLRYIYAKANSIYRKGGTLLHKLISINIKKTHCLCNIGLFALQYVCNENNRGQFCFFLFLSGYNFLSKLNIYKKK